MPRPPRSDATRPEQTAPEAASSEGRLLDAAVYDEEGRRRLRALPAVGLLLERPALQALAARQGRAAVLAAAREALADARARIRRGEPATVSDEDVERRVALRERPSLRPVINASGVIVHTNLGRAPLADEALAAVVEVARGYSSLEYDLDEGARGSRHEHAAPLLRELCGAEDAAVVNNNAAAVLLTLSALARGREVAVSRGELVEIGGGFRVPDVMRQSGAKLVEVGTTNRTRAADYEAALSDESALLLKVHRSNFALVGFTEETSLEQLAAIGRARGVPVMFDAGSGCLAPLDADRGEVTVKEALARGADVVTFSGDKLLGGPQAGVVVGRRDLVARVRAHPLMRALRPDKMALAALVVTLRLWRDRPEAVPVWRMMHVDVGTLERRAQALAARLVERASAAVDVGVVATTAKIGGGASPLVELESRAVRLRGPSPDELLRRLREAPLPVIARVESEAVLVDLRTVRDDEDEPLHHALASALGADVG